MLYKNYIYTLQDFTHSKNNFLMWQVRLAAQKLLSMLFCNAHKWEQQFWNQKK